MGFNLYFHDPGAPLPKAWGPGHKFSLSFDTFSLWGYLAFSDEARFIQVGLPLFCCMQLSEQAMSCKVNFSSTVLEK